MATTDNFPSVFSRRRRQVMIRNYCYQHIIDHSRVMKLKPEIRIRTGFEPMTSAIPVY